MERRTAHQPSRPTHIYIHHSIYLYPTDSKAPPPATVAAAGRLVEGGGLPKMWRLGKRACLSHAGLSQDSRVLLLGAQQAALDHEARFGDGDGEEMALGEVAEGVATRQQEATMQGNKRPFGASVLVAGLVPSSDNAEGGQRGRGRRLFVPRIYRTDPSGAYTLWRACAIGQVRLRLTSTTVHHVTPTGHTDTTTIIIAASPSSHAN